MEKLWVLWREWGDHSGIQIVRVYDNEKRANDDFALVEEDQIRNWHLDEVPFFALKP